MTINSYARYLSGLYSAIFFDIACAIPALRVDSERDSKRLLSIIDREGLRVLLVDLPAQGKHFDKCLSYGHLTKSGIAHQGPFRRRGIIPRLFKGLYLRVFDENGCLVSDPDLQCIRFLRLLFLVAKRFRMPCSDSSTWETVDEFFRTDRECRLPSLSWDDDCISTGNLRDLSFDDHVSPVLSGDDLFETLAGPPSICASGALTCVQLAADCVTASLGRFEPTEWRAKHGPGAVADLRREQYKYLFPNWSAKLEFAFPYADFAFANHSFWVDGIHSHKDFNLDSFEVESPSRLIAVPKTLTGPRLIASEPVSHQWCQQSIRDFMATRVSDTPLCNSVSFDSQDQNGMLAQRASHYMSHATIDLSSASDRMTCWLVERFFRASPSLIEALHASRTRWVSNDIDAKSPSLHRLRKFSTMGSAVTFPVQTYVFATVAIACVLYVRKMKVNLRNMRLVGREVRVFGDDIIVPIDASSCTQETLQCLGFKVNQSKTFEVGKFRESCGVEAYDGHDVTKVSILTAPDVTRPESIMSSVDAHNNFLLGGYLRCAEFIKSTVAGIRGIHVPDKGIDSGAFGFISFGNPGTTKSRWNPNTHKQEFFCTRLIVKSDRKEFECGSMLLQYFTEACIKPDRNEPRLGLASRTVTKLRNGWVAKELLS